MGELLKLFLTTHDERLPVTHILLKKKFKAINEENNNNHNLLLSDSSILWDRLLKNGYILVKQTNIMGGFNNILSQSVSHNQSRLTIIIMCVCTDESKSHHTQESKIDLKTTKKFGYNFLLHLKRRLPTSKYYKTLAVATTINEPNRQKHKKNIKNRSHWNGISIF